MIFFPYCYWTTFYRYGVMDSRSRPKEGSWQVFLDISDASISEEKHLYFSCGKYEIYPA
jgi:hypothetical protein